MPRMDGFELIKALREAHYNTPVLMITGMGVRFAVHSPYIVHELTPRKYVVGRGRQLEQEEELLLRELCFLAASMDGQRVADILAGLESVSVEIQTLILSLSADWVIRW